MEEKTGEAKGEGDEEGAREAEYARKEREPEMGMGSLYEKNHRGRGT